MSGIIWVVFIVAIISVVGIVYSIYGVPSQATTAIEEGVSLFREFTTTSPKGDEITVKIPTTSEGESEPVPVVVAENATEVIEVQNKARIQICYREDPNGCLLSGRAILVNPVTNKHIIPYNYNYIINVECAEIANGFDYCNISDVHASGFTFNAGKDADGNPLGGEYEYVWHPAGTTYAGTYTNDGELVQKGLYNVEVFIRSQKLLETERYEEFWDIYQVEMRP